MEKGAVPAGLLEPPVPVTGVVPLLTGYGAEDDLPDVVVLSPEGRVKEELAGATVDDTELE